MCDPTGNLVRVGFPTTPGPMLAADAATVPLDRESAVPVPRVTDP